MNTAAKEPSRLHARWAERLLVWGITPNRLTLANLVLSVLAAVGLAFGAGHAPPWEPNAPVPVSVWPIVNFAILGLAFVFDLVDGVLARASGRQSSFGAILDSTLDRYSDLLIASGCATYFAFRGNLTFMIVSLLTGMHAVVISYVKARTENFVTVGNHGFWQRGERCVIFIAGVVTGHLAAALTLLAIFPISTVVLRLRIAALALTPATEPGHVLGAGRYGGVLRRGSLAYGAALCASLLWVYAAPRLWPAWYGAFDLFGGSSGRSG